MECLSSEAAPMYQARWNITTPTQARQRTPQVGSSQILLCNFADGFVPSKSCALLQVNWPLKMVIMTYKAHERDRLVLYAIKSGTQTKVPSECREGTTSGCSNNDTVCAYLTEEFTSFKLETDA